VTRRVEPGGLTCESGRKSVCFVTGVAPQRYSTWQDSKVLATATPNGDRGQDQIGNLVSAESSDHAVADSPRRPRGGPTVVAGYLTPPSGGSILYPDGITICLFREAAMRTGEGSMTDHGAVFEAVRRG